MTYEWEVPYSADVNFQVVYEDARDAIMYMRSDETLTPARAVEHYVAGWDDAEYYSLPADVQAQITRDFIEWLEEHDLTLPQPSDFDEEEEED